LIPSRVTAVVRYAFGSAIVVPAWRARAEERVLHDVLGVAHGSGHPEGRCDGLRPMLALPVEVVLPAHGAPTDRGGLERARS
jgi:hypothetical protein